MNGVASCTIPEFMWFRPRSGHSASDVVHTDANARTAVTNIWYGAPMGPDGLAVVIYNWKEIEIQKNFMRTLEYGTWINNFLNLGQPGQPSIIAQYSVPLLTGPTLQGVLGAHFTELMFFKTKALHDLIVEYAQGLNGLGASIGCGGAVCGPSANEGGVVYEVCILMIGWSTATRPEEVHPRLDSIYDELKNCASRHVFRRFDYVPV